MELRICQREQRSTQPGSGNQPRPPMGFNGLRENPRIGGGPQLAHKQKCVPVQRNSYTVQFFTVKNMGSTDSFVDGRN